MPNATIIQIDSETYRLTGAINTDSVMSLLNQGEAYIDKGSRQICFDLSQVTESDSTGLALLVSWMRYAKRQGKKIIIKNMTQKMKDIARVSGLDSVLPLEHSH